MTLPFIQKANYLLLLLSKNKGHNIIQCNHYYTSFLTMVNKESHSIDTIIPCVLPDSLYQTHNLSIAVISIFIHNLVTDNVLQSLYQAG